MAESREILSAAVSGILASHASSSGSGSRAVAQSLRTSSGNSSSNEQGASSSSGSNSELGIGQALQQLFPQCGQRGSTETTTNRASGSTFRRFSGQSSGTKRKKKVKTEKDYSFAKDIVLKDVVLLPSPTYKKVPRGKTREMLYAEGYVSSAIEIHSNWSESEAVNVLENEFKEKFKDVPPPRFEFVRAVGNTIVKPQIKSEQGWTGKVIKHQTGQGPLYIRATKDINVLEVDSEDECQQERDLKSYFIIKERQQCSENVNQFEQEGISKDSIVSNLKSMFPYHDEEKYTEVANRSSTLEEAVDKMIACQTEGSFTSDVNLEQLDNDDLPLDECSSSALPSTLQEVLADLEPFKCSHNRINISRDAIFQDSIVAVFKNPNFDINKPCKVAFEDEPAIDGGGPKREYFTLLLESLLSPSVPVRLFEGQGGRILPIHNADALRAHLFKVAGKMITVSILNGCPGFPYLSPAVYTYIVTDSIQECLEAVSLEDVPDTEILDIISKIDNFVAGTEVDQDVLDCLVAAGFSKALKTENKNEAIMTVLLHTVILSRKAELDQFVDGLGPLLRKIRQYPEICKPLLVQNEDHVKVTAEKLKSLIVFREITDDLKKFVLDYIDMKDEQVLSAFLMFCTGTPTIPPLGFHDPEKILIGTIESSMPNVNTCPMILEVPSLVSSFEEFSAALDTAISCQSCGFGLT